PPRTADGVAAIAGHAVPDPHDSSQFLDVQVDEFAGTLSLITDNGRSGRPPATEALTLEHSRHGGPRHLQLTGDRRPAGAAMPQERDQGRAIRIGQPRHPSRNGRSVAQSVSPFPPY